MAKTRSAVSALMLAVLCTGGAPADPGEPPTWIDEPQTYNILPVTPQEALEMNITVNGVWAGFGGNSPILPYPEFITTVAPEFGVDIKAFVEANRRVGIHPVCGINGIEGMTPLREITPDLERMACRNADGEVVRWGSPSDECIVMCTNHPDWVEWQIEYGKRGIDAGAELVLFDTPQGQAVAYVIAKAGYCDRCMETFRQYLTAKYGPEELRERFDLESFDPRAVVERLRDPAKDAIDEWRYERRMEANPLFHEFLLCQEQASFDTRKALAEALRSYARSRGQRLAISGNAFQLSASNYLGYWIRGLMFADVFDLFTYENSYSVTGRPLEDVELPRGKWAPFHKLAFAATHRRCPTVVGAGSMPRFFAALAAGKPRHNAWMGALCAEAYAANGAYMTYYFEAPPGNQQAKEVFWSQATDFFGFVKAHPDLYRGELRSGSPLALVFLFNERGRTIPGVYPSYTGFSQALIEGSYPFDVVFAGDDRYVKDVLRPEHLAPFQALLVPSPIEPTENQKAVLQAFVKAGGTLVTAEPERLGFDRAEAGASDLPCIAADLRHGQGRVLVLAGDITDTWTDDAGSRFFRDYDAAILSEIASLARALGLKPMLADPDPRVGAYPILQPDRGRAIVHLVNYDVDYDADVVREKRELTLAVPRPDFLDDGVRCIVYAPGEATPSPIDLTVEGGTLTCTVPRLATGCTVVFEAKRDDNG